MPTKPRKRKQPDRPPLYDPTVHTDPELVVFTELYCQCGALWRQRDPASHVAPRVAEFVALHTGRGHGPASKAQTMHAREARREAKYVARGRAADFRARTYSNVDTTDTEVRPWPRFHVRAPMQPSAARSVPAVPRRLTEGELT